MDKATRDLEVVYRKWNAFVKVYGLVLQKGAFYKEVEYRNRKGKEMKTKQPAIPNMVGTMRVGDRVERIFFHVAPYPEEFRRLWTLSRRQFNGWINMSWTCRASTDIPIHPLVKASGVTDPDALIGALTEQLKECADALLVGRWVPARINDLRRWGYQISSTSPLPDWKDSIRWFPTADDPTVGYVQLRVTGGRNGWHDFVALLAKRRPSFSRQLDFSCCLQFDTHACIFFGDPKYDLGIAKGQVPVNENMEGVACYEDLDVFFNPFSEAHREGFSSPFLLSETKLRRELDRLASKERLTARQIQKTPSHKELADERINLGTNEFFDVKHSIHLYDANKHQRTHWMRYMNKFFAHLPHGEAVYCKVKCNISGCIVLRTVKPNAMTHMTKVLDDEEEEQDLPSQEGKPRKPKKKLMAKKIKLMTTWMQDPEHAVYESLVFEPGLPTVISVEHSFSERRSTASVRDADDDPCYKRVSCYSVDYNLNLFVKPLYYGHLYEYGLRSLAVCRTDQEIQKANEYDKAVSLWRRAVRERSNQMGYDEYADEEELPMPDVPFVGDYQFLSTQDGLKAFLSKERPNGAAMSSMELFNAWLDDSVQADLNDDDDEASERTAVEQGPELALRAELLHLYCVLCDKDWTLFKRTLAQMRRIVFLPESRLERLNVSFGVQGLGKTAFWLAFGQWLLGQGCLFQVSTCFFPFLRSPKIRPSSPSTAKSRPTPRPRCAVLL